MHVLLRAHNTNFTTDRTILYQQQKYSWGSLCRWGVKQECAVQWCWTYRPILLQFLSNSFKTWRRLIVIR